MQAVSSVSRTGLVFRNQFGVKPDYLREYEALYLGRENVDWKNYDALTSYLFKLRRFGRTKTTENVRYFLKLLGNPQNSFKTILVGGSSGKGSTARLIASILQKAGYRVGLYTKPHLLDYTERISVNGKRISKHDVVRIINDIRPAMEKLEDGEHHFPAFSETTLALAVSYFKEKKADYAVIEVGLGGRRDACNAVDPVVSVITNVALVHTKLIGKTISEIAEEKAGIVRPNGTLVTTANNKALQVFKRICSKQHADLHYVSNAVSNVRGLGLRGQLFDLKCLGKYYSGLLVGMFGNYQVLNSAAAVYAARLAAAVPEKAIRTGLASAKHPGRFEVIRENPLVVVDCAKDPDAFRKLRKSVEANLEYGRLITVLSISDGGKDVDSMLKTAASMSDFVIATRHRVKERALQPAEIKRRIESFLGRCMAFDDSKDAIRKALSIAGKADLVLITGSVFLVGEALKLLKHEV
ncbi:hypothetical protein HY546_01885 [archaeon]|nr:hypothetical protein [archaeon]